MPAPTVEETYTAYGNISRLFTCKEPEIMLAGPAGTGKSRGNLEYLNYWASEYPRARILMLRKTRRSLTESGMVTFEQKVLNPAQGVRFHSSMQQYQYPNGSIIAVGGLDKPSKIMSSEWDIIFAQESTELTDEDWEMCGLRVRNGKLPVQQIIGDCNPGPSTHWLKQRAQAGGLLMMETTHEDNPVLFTRNGEMTAEGVRYIGKLDNLTGVRYARYRLGLWVSAEGMVYEQEWNPAVNIVNSFPIPKEWPRYLAVDFGYVHAFVCLWAALDPDGRIYIYRQIYKTRTLVEDHAKVIKNVSRWGQDGGDPLPREIICDHNAEDRATLERHLGLHTMPAHKSVSDGIQATASRFRVQGDGKPRVMIMRDSLVERDHDLAEGKLPTCVQEEPESYIWDTRQGMKKGEAPVKENDHGCLVAGTLIKTANGDTPIEHIQVGDYVLTRNGYQRVIAAGLTQQNAEVYTVHFSNGATLTGTGNHPIYLSGQGYTPLRAMRYGDIIMTTEQAYERLSLWEEIRENQKLSSTMVSSSDVTPNHLHGVSAITTALTQVIEKLVSCDFIKKYGVMRMVQFQRDMKFITKMKTRLIMPWIIWNASQKKSIRSAMNYTRSRHVDSSYGSTLLQRYERRQNNGMRLLKVKRGMLRWLRWLGMMPNSTITFVNNVVSHFNLALWTGTKFYSARMLANPYGAISQELITRHAIANNVGVNLSAIAMQEKSIAPLLVNRSISKSELNDNASIVGKRSLLCHQNRTNIAPPHVLTITCTTDKQDVYNLTVDNTVGEGEYFANGILVHNCDALRYLVARFDLKPTDVRYSNRIY